jgi:acetyltransferase-like isoleucine patch superfamily enzyme/acyl carrier protein
VTVARSLGRATVHALDSLRSRAALRSATRVGDHVRIFGWPRIANDGNLVVGAGVTFVSTPAPVALLVASGAVLVIGDRALIESGVTIRAQRRVTIGRGARIGPGCIIDDDGPDREAIAVGDGAWVEDGAVLLGGVSVAEGAVFRREVPAGASERVAPPPGAAPVEIDGLASGGDVDRRVRAVLARIVVGGSTADSTALFRDVKGWDSLAALRLLVALEKEFAVVLPHRLFALHPSVQSVNVAIAQQLAKRAELG